MNYGTPLKKVEWVEQENEKNYSMTYTHDEYEGRDPRRLDGSILMEYQLV